MYNYPHYHDPRQPLPPVPTGYQNWRQVYREAQPAVRARFEACERPSLLIAWDTIGKAKPHDLGGLELGLLAVYAAREQAEEDVRVGVFNLVEVQDMYYALKDKVVTTAHPRHELAQRVYEWFKAKRRDFRRSTDHLS